MYEEFNIEKYAIPYIGDLFRAELNSNKEDREPRIEKILWTKEKAQLDIGYQVYDKDYPAPLPTQNYGGLFGQLFGVTFQNVNSNKPTHFIRSISTVEYIKVFGYSSDFNYEILQSGKFL